MTREELFDIIRPIILTVTSVPEVILADPNAPSPLGAYASVETKQAINQRGQANIRRATSVTPQSVDVDIRAQIIADCSINFYRGNARDLAERLLQANKRPDISGILFTAGLGWFGAGAVNNLTALQSDSYEQRAQVTIRLAYVTTDPLVINSIEAIPWEVQYEDATVVASGKVLSV